MFIFKEDFFVNIVALSFLISIFYFFTTPVLYFMVFLFFLGLILSIKTGVEFYKYEKNNKF